MPTVGRSQALHSLIAKSDLFKAFSQLPVDRVSRFLASDIGVHRVPHSSAETADGTSHVSAFGKEKDFIHEAFLCILYACCKPSTV